MAEAAQGKEELLRWCNERLGRLLGFAEPQVAE